ncbi:MAG: leucine-rich repeat protein [Alistipes sp.]|jgi:hypothetical protein|nr:leucine-rich repeat protein [Alistipes sp.]
MKNFTTKFARACVMTGVATSLLLSGCTAMRDDIDNLKDRVETLEEIVDALNQKQQNGFLVEDVTELQPAGSGWLVTFTDGSSIEIRNGAKGDQGEEGETGPQGPQGPQGGKGDKGDGGIEVRVNADGSVTFVMNDGQNTEYTFARHSTATSFELTLPVAVEFVESQSVEVTFRVNPSTAWIPTGEGEAIAKWTLDETGKGAISTRAGSNPSEVFAIESIVADEGRKGQYVATIAGDFSKHDAAQTAEYYMMMVLNNNGGTDAANDTHISSRSFIARFVEKVRAVVIEGDMEVDGGEVHWALMDDGLFVVSGQGAMLGHTSNSQRPWYAQRNNITEVVIGEGVTTVGRNAFYQCKSLTKVTLPESLEIIDQHAFYDCSLLENVAIPGGVTAINNSAFARCIAFTEAVIPDHVTTIGNSLFDGCKNITAATIGSGITKLGNNTFSGTAITGIVIPGTIVDAGMSTFQNCASLVEVTIEEGVTTFGMSCFMGCTALLDVVLPNSAKTLSTNTFNGCSALRSVKMGSGVTTIGNNVFNSPVLYNVEIGAAMPPALGTGNFPATDDLLMVPAGAVADYNETAWAAAFATIADETPRVRLSHLYAADFWPENDLNGSPAQVNGLTIRLTTGNPDDAKNQRLYYDINFWLDCAPLDMSDYSIDIPEGTYNVSGDGGVSTLWNEFAQVTPFVYGERGATLKIAGGAMVVDGDSDHYDIAFDFTLSDGSEFHADWSGPMAVSNPWKPIFSSFTEDQNFGTVALDAMQFYPDGLGDGTVDGYMFHAVTPGITSDRELGYLGTGWVIQAQISATIGSEGHIPDGDYTLAPDTDRSPWRMLEGTMPEMNALIGSWAVHYVDSRMVGRAPLKNGTFSSTRGEDGVYSIGIDATDDRGNTIVGSIEGDPQVTRYTVR